MSRRVSSVFTAKCRQAALCGWTDATSENLYLSVPYSHAVPYALRHIKSELIRFRFRSRVGSGAALIKMWHASSLTLRPFREGPPRVVDPRPQSRHRSAADPIARRGSIRAGGRLQEGVRERARNADQMAVVLAALPLRIEPGHRLPVQLVAAQAARPANRPGGAYGAGARHDQEQPENRVKVHRRRPEKVSIIDKIRVNTKI